MTNFTFVGVQFDNYSKVYHYKTNLTLSVNDFAVVETPHIGLALARVSHIDCDIEPNQEIKYKWLVQKVDFTEYDKVKNT